MIRVIISCIFSYLIGSISPSYILGRILKGIDIREYGDGNAGTVNIYRVIGLFPSIITAIFDLSKGILSFYISQKFLKIDGIFLCIPIIFSIIGHILPFYLGFRGGQGAATSTGFLLYLFGIQIIEGVYPLETLLVLVILVILTTYVARKGEFVGIVILPLFLFLNIYLGGKNYPSLYLSIVTIYLLGLQIFNIVKFKFYKIESSKDMQWWRVILRPLAVLFIIIDHIYGKKSSLLLIGIVALVFLIFDLTRLAHGKIERLIVSDLKYLIKKSEVGKFSSMTLFLFASFSIFLIFSNDIAYLSFTFLVFGDMFSKIYGMKFGRKKIMGERTLEGSISYFVGSVWASYPLCLLIGVDIKILLIGAIIASLVELFSIGLDDNFSVGLLSGIGMTALKFFKVF